MKTAFLGLHAETSIHAGAGAALDAVDLPIQRENHTGWPCVFGSAVKGALRSAAVARQIASGQIHSIFGPETTNASDYAGALLVGDARLLLLPVRSLTGHFKWITCPAVLQRLQRDASRLQIAGFDYTIPEPKLTEGSDAPRAIGCKGNDALYMEEYRFEVSAENLHSVITAIAKLSGISGIENALVEQLVIVCNDDFSFLCRNATAITPHIAIESETKTVKGGALWYEETLPPETLLYTTLAADADRSKDKMLSAEAVLNIVTNDLFGKNPYLQLGGNETVGMGWCKVAIHSDPI